MTPLGGQALRTVTLQDRVNFFAEAWWARDAHLTDYGLRTTDYGLRTTDYGLRTTDYGLRLVRTPKARYPSLNNSPIGGTPMNQRFPQSAALFSLLAAFFVAPVHAQVCPFENSGASLANEGLVLTRYALGLRSAMAWVCARLPSRR
jgi:hypothetical protein